jgi:predicted peptidase
MQAGQAPAQAPAQGAQAAGRGGPPPAPQPIPGSPLYQAKGEMYRVYDFPGTGESIPYRLFVPSRWTPQTRLPMLVTLRAGNSVNNSYRSNNDFVKQGEARGYIVVTPMGYRGISQPYYGSTYKLNRANAAAPGAGWTEQEAQRAEQDVLYVIDLVAKEYNADTSRIFLHGQNPSGSGALYLGAKYPEKFAGLVISSAPIVDDGYPYDKLKAQKVAVLFVHGDQDTTNPLAESQKMAEKMKSLGIDSEFLLVPGGVHLEAYLTGAAKIFDFLDKHKK